MVRERKGTLMKVVHMVHCYIYVIYIYIVKYHCNSFTKLLMYNRSKMCVYACFMLIGSWKGRKKL